MKFLEPDKILYYNYKFEKIWVQFRKARRRISCNFNFGDLLNNSAVNLFSEK